MIPSSNLPPKPHAEQIAELAAELDRLVRREAAYRARTVQESLEYRKTIKNQAREFKELQNRAAGLDTYVHRLHLELAAARRNDRAAKLDAYVHQLHLEREENRRELRQAAEDLEAFVQRLREAEDEAAARRDRLESIRRSWSWKLAAPLRALQSRLIAAAPALQPAGSDVPGAPFTYYLRTSPYRIYREPSFMLEGWAFPEDGRPVTAVRARVDGRVFPGTWGLEEPDVLNHPAALPHNPRPGLRIPFETPPGRHHLSLEACLDGRDWVSFLTTPIWAEHRNGVFA